MLECPYCEKRPHEITEYIEQAEYSEVTPEEFVKMDEGTYDYRTDLFCCTTCYIKIGMPLNSKLHEAFAYYRKQVKPLQLNKK